MVMKLNAVALLATLGLVAEAISTGASLNSSLAVNGGQAPACHPQCRWACDDPQCPALCHPVCERPKCEMTCEQTPCAKCVVHCSKPICSVRCPQDMCERDSCPQCETVCSPAQCHTKCIAPEPKCAPVCEETMCQWKCRKPSQCPRPKCQLQCQKPVCDGTEKQQCCECALSLIAMNSIANANHNTPQSHMPHGEQMPTFLEVHHNMRQLQGGMCCPCGAPGSLPPRSPGSPVPLSAPGMPM